MILARTLLIPLSLYILAAAPAGALTITTADGVGADTFVQWVSGGSQPDTNYGDASTIRIDDPFFTPTAEFNGTLKTYLRFDLSALAGETVATATLDLVFRGGDALDTEINVWALDDGDPGESWDEGTITWNNAPGNFQHVYLMDFNRVTQLGPFVRSQDAQVGDVVHYSSTALADILNMDTNGQVTLMLTGASGSPCNQTICGILTSFASKENPNPIAVAAPPSLAITIVPKPSTALLMMLGLLGLSTAQARDHSHRV